MTIVLDGSNGITAPGGTAAAPSITTTGDTNTGIFFPAADTIAFSEGGVEAARFDSSGNLGIGTTSPDVKLRVDAASPTRGIVETVRGTGSTGAQIAFSQDAVADWAIGQPAGANAFAFFSGRSPGADGTERMRLDSSGNLGINTSSPSTFGKVAIQVTGTTTPTSAVNVGPSSINLYAATNGSSTDGTTGIFGWNASTPGIGSGIGFSRESSADWGTQIRFYTHPTATSNIGDITERARIDSSGNLGIGTTSPTAKLHVWQTGATTSLKIDGIENPIFATRYVASADGAVLFLAKSRNATVGSQTIVQNGDELGTLKGRGSDGTNFVDAAYITFAVDGTPGTNDMPGRIVFGTSPDGSASIQERARITSAGDFGIGTTSPTTGSLSNVATLNAGLFATLRGTVASTSGVAVTIGTAISSTNVGYIVSCGVPSADPANYCAVAVVSADSGVLRVTALQTAVLMSISVSGTSIRATQSSGAAATIYFNILRVS